MSLHDPTLNADGYLLTRSTPDGPRTYVCADRYSLNFLIHRLTGRSADTYAIDERDLPVIPDIRIAHHVHIYTSSDENTDLRERDLEEIARRNAADEGGL